MKEVQTCSQFARAAAEEGDLGVAAVSEKLGRDAEKRFVRFQAVPADMGRPGNSETVTA